MEPSRRAVLSVLSLGTAAGLSAVAGAGPAWAASGASRAPGAATGPRGAAAADEAGGDEAAVLANTVAMLAGTEESNARPDVAAKVAAIQKTARDRLALLTPEGDGALFTGVPLGTSDSNLTRSFQYLYEIALATSTPPGPTPPAGDVLYGDEDTRRRVIDGLARLYDEYYGDQSKGYYGNWFNWEIGISQHVSKALVLLRDTLAGYRPDLTATYVAAMDGYLRNGKDGDVDLDSRFHTGANLADITTNRVLQGAVLDDPARISKAVSDQLTVLATVDPYDLKHGVTDGFYADGSFIQHASVAYTGTYGTGLLSRVVQTVKLLDGTGYLGDADPAAVARGWVRDGFAPLIFEGWMMEAVKGRGASRSKSGYGDVATVVEAVVDLSAYSTGTDATALRGYVKHLHATTKAPLDPATFVSPVSIARYADILADASVPAHDLKEASYTAAFHAMERTVHHRPGFAFALARSSERISKYEYMSGENLMPWFQGDGAHYLYLSGQDQTEAYGAAHFAVVPPYRLAGVTAPVETRKTVPELYGTAWYDNPGAGFTSSSESQNTYVYFPRGTNAFSGGATLGDLAAAGLVQSDDVAWAAKQAGELPGDFVAYRNATATKSWFLLDDEIVVLAAGVGDPAGRAVTTTVDSRIAAPGDTLALTGRFADGTPWPGPGAQAAGHSAPLAWLRYANDTRRTAVGYAFLTGPRNRGGAAGHPAPAPTAPPTATLETVTRSLQAVNTTNPATSVTKQVFWLGVEQTAGAPEGTLAYALLPGATEARLRAYAHEPLTVLANTPRLQAVEHTGLGLLAANAFVPGTHRVGRRLTVDGPASVLLREGRDGALSLAVCDPTTHRDTVTITVHGRPLRTVTADDGVGVHRVPGGTRVEVTTRHAYGRSLTATLR
ncbi:polysaccharide lyase family 8 super-sandwich domain-containing protein [Streptomyces sp. TS71-3]|uniref:polysaccharide lyase family 8 super-sandwich domain-containing protein n=1 Tax=Streptomyces sp. TS71-3 TaxID=2733862 RepID=UPI001B194294|nr:polysaccharide lyase family 8 super-sandwich domain-containing protein [Streptomyces sp. TS71-3]GHJ34650.1 hyaluronate lyase [Streptomyces sp. TS71-3]